jgi:hypothetical protein
MLRTPSFLTAWKFFPILRQSEGDPVLYLEADRRASTLLQRFEFEIVALGYTVAWQFFPIPRQSEGDPVLCLEA